MLLDLVISLADFLLQLTGEVSEVDLEILDNLCGALLQQYQSALDARHFLFHRAFYSLLYALHFRGHSGL